MRDVIRNSTPAVNNEARESRGDELNVHAIQFWRERLVKAVKVGST